MGEVSPSLPSPISATKSLSLPKISQTLKCGVWNDNSKYFFQKCLYIYDMTQQAKRMHELYEECKHIGLSETSDVIESAASAEEAEFFAKAFDIILQQKQKNVVAEKGF